jgi:hypothetical protein
LTEEREPETPWNDPARIACEFAFKCPKTWDRLALTADANIRHCSECDRDVHLALTQEDLRRHADKGHCVAVVAETSAKKPEFHTMVGMLRSSHDPLK